MVNMVGGIAMTGGANTVTGRVALRLLCSAQVFPVSRQA